MGEGIATHYVAVVSKDTDDEFRVHFPDLPGCFTRGATREQACRFAAETLAFHLTRFAAHRMSMPVARDLEAIQAQLGYRDSNLLLVEASALAN